MNKIFFFCVYEYVIVVYIYYTHTLYHDVIYSSPLTYLKYMHKCICMYIFLQIYYSSF